jgi:GT2 family glycosyltransferase
MTEVQPGTSDHAGQVTSALIVVTYGDRGQICAATLRAAEAAGATHIVVVLNGASPDSHAHLKDFVATAGSTVVLVHESINRGSAPAVRRGLTEARRRWNPAFYWLLDDDTVPRPETLRIQLDACRRLNTTDSPAAVLGYRPAIKQQRLVAERRTAHHYPSSASFMYFDLRQRLRQRSSRAVPTSTVGSQKTEVVVPYGPYGGLLIPSNLQQRIGLPNPAFVLYEDDTEYLSRIGRAGGQLVLLLNARIDDAVPNWLSESDRSTHGPGRLLRSGSPAKLYYSTRNRVYFDCRRPGGNKVVLLLNAFLYLGVLGMSIRTRRQFNAARVIARAVVDGALARLGQHPSYPLV